MSVTQALTVWALTFGGLASITTGSLGFRVPSGVVASCAVARPQVLPESCDTAHPAVTHYCGEADPEFGCPSCPGAGYCTTACTNVTTLDAAQTTSVARRAIRASCNQLGATRQIRRCDMATPCDCAQGTLLDDDAPCDIFTPANIGGGC